MPLDSLQTVNDVDSDIITLARAAEILGITPIPQSRLDAHKQSEVRKHRGTWVGRHPDLADALLRFYAVVAMFGGVLGMLVIIFSLTDSLISNSSPNQWLLGVSSGCIITFTGSIVLCCMIMDWDKIYLAQAKWIETEQLYRITIPADIRRLGNHIKSLVPEAHLVVGTLVQEKVILDPYLLMRCDKQPDLIVGIWDDAGILQIAKQKGLHRA